MRERIADSLGELRLLADQAELLAQPWLHGLEDRPALFLARDPTCIGIMATDRGFDAIELGDALEGFAGDRSGTGLSELVEASPHMRPAQG
jgi:hypothetical protein